MGEYESGGELVNWFIVFSLPLFFFFSFFLPECHNGRLGTGRRSAAQRVFAHVAVAVGRWGRW